MKRRPHTWMGPLSFYSSNLDQLLCHAEATYFYRVIPPRDLTDLVRNQLKTDCQIGISGLFRGAGLGNRYSRSRTSENGAKQITEIIYSLVGSDRSQVGRNFGPFPLARN